MDLSLGESFQTTLEDLDSPAAWDGFRPYLAVLASTQMQKENLARPLLARIDPEDIVQETLLKAWEHRSQFKGASRGEFLAWLRTMLSNVLMDHLRALLSGKRNVMLEVRLDLDQTSRNLEAWLAERDAVTPCTRLGREEEVNRLCKAILRLRPVAKSVILARHIEGLTLDQIAARLGKTREAVAKAWSRAVRQLHELMSEGPR